MADISELQGKQTRNKEKISVVIPCYRSKGMIAEVVAMTREVLVGLGHDYEFVLVDDGSGDGTFLELKRLSKGDSKIKAIGFSKNFGQHNALLCGLRHVTGELVLGMDDDFQSHPSQIPVILNSMSENVDVVYAIADKRDFDGLIRKYGSRIERWTLRVLTGRPRDIDVSSFWLARRFVCEEVGRYTGDDPHISSLILRATSNIKNVKVSYFGREQGSSGYSLKKLLRVYGNLFSYSLVPLRMVTALGASTCIVSIAATILLLALRVADPSMQPGWSSLIITLFFSTGLIVFCLGVIGEYLGRLFTRASATPQYVIRSVAGVELPKDKGNCCDVDNP